MDGQENSDKEEEKEKIVARTIEEERPTKAEEPLQQYRPAEPHRQEDPYQDSQRAHEPPQREAEIEQVKQELQEERPEGPQNERDQQQLIKTEPEQEYDQLQPNPDTSQPKPEVLLPVSDIHFTQDAQPPAFPNLPPISTCHSESINSQFNSRTSNHTPESHHSSTTSIHDDNDSGPDYYTSESESGSEPESQLSPKKRAKRERLRSERDKIKPSYYYGEKELEEEAIKRGIKPPKRKPKGLRGVPVFEPSMEQFRNFYSYINQIDRWGMRSGIVKIIPPKEWSEQLPHLGQESLRTDGKGQMLRNAKIKSPISQVIQGSRGLFRVMNVAKRKTYNALEWYDLANSDEHRPPDFSNKTLDTSSANFSQDHPDMTSTRSTRSSRRSTSSIAPISHRIANPRRRKVSKGTSTAETSTVDQTSPEKPAVEGPIECSTEKRNNEEPVNCSPEKRDDEEKNVNCPSLKNPHVMQSVTCSPEKQDLGQHFDCSPSKLLPVPEDQPLPCPGAKDPESPKPAPSLTVPLPQCSTDATALDSRELAPSLPVPLPQCSTDIMASDSREPAPSAPVFLPPCSTSELSNTAMNHEDCPKKDSGIMASCSAEPDRQQDDSNTIETLISDFVNQSQDLQVSCAAPNQPSDQSQDLQMSCAAPNQPSNQSQDLQMSCAAPNQPSPVPAETNKENDKKKPRRSLQNAPTPEEWAQFVECYEKLPYDASKADYTFQVCREIEQEYWRTIGNGGQPMYGADTMGSLFDERTKDWNVANLDNLLTRLKLKKKIPGVNTPYLYFGTWRATFAWHVEDADLYSINYIHFGAPKFWYSIPQEHNPRFKSFMSSSFAKERRTCSQFLRHKAFLASPSVLSSVGVQLNKVVHLPGEIILTYPYGYHSGFNLGYNCAESVNFANEAWIEKGRKAQSCKCIDDAVTINVDAWIAEHDELCRKQSETEARTAEKLRRQQKREERKRKGSENVDVKAPKKRQKKENNKATTKPSVGKIKVTLPAPLNPLIDPSLANPTPQKVKAPRKKKKPANSNPSNPPLPEKKDGDHKPVVVFENNQQTSSAPQLPMIPQYETGVFQNNQQGSSAPQLPTIPRYEPGVFQTNQQASNAPQLPNIPYFGPDAFANNHQSSDAHQFPNISYFADQKFLSAVEAGLIDSRLL
ncbi:hypothetical protein PGTUg99_024725 [Puccinia graminis f. sp. tritici]|uniref:[Histone H3]-trimethyl-L-lysine(9) demethylase n=1 Tax=Puccinia graminis f. sp. tritici TaxID=56615 RepID=A0A5B0SKZ7_PUCGR|nr:hypothetical protein PGTUg99_024725 [Puccinia graminis f. sp. tritici]